MGDTKNIAINVAYNTLMMLFPTKVVVRNVSGLFLKKFIELANILRFREATSSFNLFAETKAISDPEKNPLKMMVSTIRSHSMLLAPEFYSRFATRWRLVAHELIIGSYLPEKLGFRFSKKAEVPSLKSSVAKSSPNRVASVR